MTDHRSGAAMLRMPVATLSALHLVLTRDRGPEEAARLARELGFEAGEAFHAAFTESLSAEESVGELSNDDFWRRLAGFFSSLGWGELRFEQLHAGVASLSSSQWAEAEGRSSEQPLCHLTTGLLADLLSRVAGTDLAVLEVECRASGAAECRFLVGSVEALDGVYQQLRTGSPFVEALAKLA